MAPDVLKDDVGWCVRLRPKVLHLSVFPRVTGTDRLGAERSRDPKQYGS